MRKLVQTLLMAAMLTALPEAALAQNATGEWSGVLEIVPGTRLRLAVHIAAGPDGRLGGTLDSLDQNAIGLPLADVTLTGDHLALRLDRPPARFEGSWDPADKAWRGEWRQNGQAWQLVLTSGKPPAAIAPTQPPVPINWTLPSDSEIAAMIDTRIAARHGAGIAIGVIDRSGRRIVTRSVAGAAASGFDVRTIFEIGSMSKVFTALMLADMVSKGEVSLDDPAEKYLPAGAKMPERGGHKITLRDLGSQTSGLPRLPDNMPVGNPDDPYSDYSEKLLLDFLSRYQLTRDIGSQFEYSNLGFGLLGYLLARAGHTDYATLLATRITGPLGMRDTTIMLSPDQQRRFAPGHDRHMRPARPWTLPTLAGAGAIRSTADDMLTFLAAAMNPASPIGPAMKLATGGRRPTGKPSTEIGLGWIISQPTKGRETLFHNGGTGGFRSAMLLDPARRSGVVVLANAAVEPATDDLATHILLGTPVLAAPPVPAAPQPPSRHDEVTLPSSALDQVVGRYEFAPGVVLTVERDGPGLKAQLTGQPAHPIFPEAPLRFFLRVVDAQLRFTACPNGEVTGVELIQSGREVSGKRTTS